MWEELWQQQCTHVSVNSKWSKHQMFPSRATSQRCLANHSMRHRCSCQGSRLSTAMTGTNYDTRIIEQTNIHQKIDSIKLSAQGSPSWLHHPKRVGCPPRTAGGDRASSCPYNTQFILEEMELSRLSSKHLSQVNVHHAAHPRLWNHQTTWRSKVSRMGSSLTWLNAMARQVWVDEQMSKTNEGLWGGNSSSLPSHHTCRKCFCHCESDFTGLEITWDLFGFASWLVCGWCCSLLFSCCCALSFSFFTSLRRDENRKHELNFITWCTCPEDTEIHSHEVIWWLKYCLSLEIGGPQNSSLFQG